MLAEAFALYRRHFGALVLTCALALVPANLLAAGAVLFGIASLGSAGVAEAQTTHAEQVQKKQRDLQEKPPTSDADRDARVQSALETAHHAAALQLGDNDIGSCRNRVVQLIQMVLHRINGIADVLVVPSDHAAEFQVPDADGDLPISRGLRNPNQLAAAPTHVAGLIRRACYPRRFVTSREGTEQWKGCHRCREA